MMQIKHFFRGFAFSRNPIVIHIDAPEGDATRGSGSFTVKVAGGESYAGVFYPPCDLDISDIVEGELPSWPEITTLSGIGSVPLAAYSVVFSHSLDDTDTASFYALPGGVSRQNLRRYADAGTDPFSARFLNDRANFFFTVRSSGWRIPVREDELSGFFFIAPEPVSITASDPGSGKSKSYGPVTGLCALDLQRVFNDLGGPRCIDISRNGRRSCRFEITAAEPSLEKHVVVFRNSLGVMERMLLTGRGTAEHNWEGAEEAAYKTFDETVHDFTGRKLRTECSSSVKIDTGFLSPERIGLLADMLASDECYLLDNRAGAKETRVRVIPSIDTLTHQTRQSKPEKFEVTFKLADTETSLTPDIGQATDAERGKIFTSEFDSCFQ